MILIVTFLARFHCSITIGSGERAPQKVSKFLAANLTDRRCICGWLFYFFFSLNRLLLLLLCKCSKRACSDVAASLTRAVLSSCCSPLCSPLEPTSLSHLARSRSMRVLFVLATAAATLMLLAPLHTAGGWCSATRMRGLSLHLGTHRLTHFPRDFAFSPFLKACCRVLARRPSQ